MRDLLTPLSRTKQIHLFEAISSGQLHQDAMGPEIARMLVEMLNASRSEHARRLWTVWFEPIIQRDDLTLLAASRLPGCMHVIDVGAWWFTLAGFMDEPVRRIQAAITGLAKDQPLDKILRSDEVRDWGEELRSRSLEVLAGCRAKPGLGNRLVADANAHRARLLKDCGLPITAMLTPADLALLTLALEAAPAWKRLERPGVWTDADALLRGASGLVSEGLCTSEGAVLLALAPVHAGRDPDAASRLYRSFGLPGVRDAMVGHFQFATQMVGQWLDRRYLAKAKPLPAIIERQDPALLLTAVFGWYDATQGADMTQDERARTLVNTALGTLIAQIEQELVPVVTQRILIMTPRSEPGPDMERVDFITEFRAGFARRGIATVNRPWSPAVGDHVAGLFQALAVSAAQTPRPDQDVLALARWFDLAAVVGGRIEVTAINNALIAVVGTCLRARTEIDPVERRLIDQVVTVVREERRRSKWWVSPEINSLLEIADQRGL